MNQTTKRYIVSSLLTFFTGFIVGILPVLENLTAETLSQSALFGLVLAGLRAGLKALIEYLSTKV